MVMSIDNSFNSEMNLRSQIEKMICDVFEGLETNGLEDPIIGIAAGDDSYFGLLKKQIGDVHWTPSEAFAQKYGDAPDSAKLRVMSIVFVRELRVVKEEEWEALVQEFYVGLERSFEEKGIRCVCPDLLLAAVPMESDNISGSSSWSQKHAAYAAGLGTFGLNGELISKRGIAVRITSVIVEMDLPVDGRVSRDPFGWCNRCGNCTGKDQTELPCSNHPPKSAEINYRQIQPTDNPQLAYLVRAGLKGYDLDIPGTAYFDLQLDRLYEYYMADPVKRNYFVAVNEQGRVLGGIGIDVFENLDGYAELQKLYVAEDCRGQGIASHLIEMLEEEASRLGYKGIYIETHSNLQAAKRLYRNMGYQLIERPEFSVHETMDTFLIKKLG